MVMVNLAKFRSSEQLATLLKDTAPKVLVEASPYDKIWGVGLGENNDLILDESNWDGMNLLGKALMNVRDQLLNPTEWHSQALEDEKLWYLTQLHPEDGIITELFYETEAEMITFIKENNLTIS